MSFNDKEIYAHSVKYNYFPPYNKWYKLSGEARLDSLESLNRMNSIRLTSSEKDSIKKAEIHYPLDLSEIEGKNLVIEGNYKSSKGEKNKISFHLIKSKVIEMEVDSLIIESPNSTEWQKFHFESSMHPQLRETIFCIRIEGDVDLLINDCHAWIDNRPLSEFVNIKHKAEEDTEFDQGSGIQLGELTTQKVENIQALCRIWGFMKYYHPEITKGKYNWDYELFRILPLITNAENKNERNHIFNKWIDKYGRIKETVDYSIEDSSRYSRFINLNWIDDTELFDKKIISKLHKIKNAKRNNKFNYYIIPPLVGREESPLTIFKREKEYKNISWKDQGFRTLTLFRLWNIIEYCFPYTEYTDCSWSTLLIEFIPKLIFPENELNYMLAIRKLAAKINDSHGDIAFKSDKLYEVPFYPFRRKNVLPVELIQSAEGDIVVKSTRSIYFERGDIIKFIDGKNINHIIKDMSPYVIASNKGGLINGILHCLLSTSSNELKVEITRNSKEKLLKINDFSANASAQGVNSWRKYNLDSKNILHCYGKKNAQEIKDMVSRNMKSKGLIIDLRNISIGNIEALRSLLLTHYPLWISQNEKTFPGNYKIKPGYDKIRQTTKNSDFKGKIVILVDENTISHKETFAMEFRTAPNSVVIGRQTAGANGNICIVALPGGINLRYSQLGAYYPHWEILQRKGVMIDIPVSPTINDIKEGKDVWIEKAIEIIEN